MTVPSWRRVSALLYKEWLDLSQLKIALVPIALMAGMLTLPFLIAIGIPALTGESLSDDGDIARAIETARKFWPGLAGATAEAAAQAFFFQQFLMMVVLVPVTGAMTLASHSVIGEKQSRSLEPLLATPVTTLEILLAKVLASLVPAVALAGVGFALYLAAIAVFAAPGVLGLMVSARTFLIVFGLGTLAALIALQLAVIASSWASDARSAQQIGTLVILPVIALVIGQGTGAFWLTTPLLVAIGVVLVAIWLVLLLVAIAVFDQERMLTRWK